MKTETFYKIKDRRARIKNRKPIPKQQEEIAKIRYYSLSLARPLSFIHHKGLACSSSTQHHVFALFAFVNFDRRARGSLARAKQVQVQVQVE
jgi:hypothetical protein